MAANMTPDTTTDPWVPEDTFAVRLGIVRVALGGLNIKEAATLCGISPESWRRWEDGKSPRNLDDTCWQIHQHTGIDYGWLMMGGPLTSIRTGSFSSHLAALADPTGQGSLLADDLSPLDFYSRADLALV